MHLARDPEKFVDRVDPARYTGLLTHFLQQFRPWPKLLIVQRDKPVLLHIVRHEHHGRASFLRLLESLEPDDRVAVPSGIVCPAGTCLTDVVALARIPVSWRNFPRVTRPRSFVCCEQGGRAVRLTVPVFNNTLQLLQQVIMV